MIDFHGMLPTKHNLIMFYRFFYHSSCVPTTNTKDDEHEIHSLDTIEKMN